MNELNLSSARQDATGLLTGQYWAELRIFAEVARAKSFNRAAERLGVSQPTIGRKVRRLQDIIGAKLFVATKHGVHLTQRGEELAAALLVLDQSLFTLASDIKARDQDAEGVVRVSITEGLAAFFAVPAIPAFSARHPKIQLHLRSLNAFSDLRENQTDMMLTVVPAERPDLVCTPLGTLHFIPIASEDYVERRGLPTRERLADHLFVQSHIYESGAAMWRGWQDVCAEGTVAHRCDNPFAYGMMVKHSLGIGLLGAYAVRERSAVAVDLGIDVPVPFYAVALSERLEARPVRLAYQWMCDTFGEHSPWFRKRLNLDELPDELQSLDVMSET